MDLDRHARAHIEQLFQSCGQFFGSFLEALGDQSCRAIFVVCSLSVADWSCANLLLYQLDHRSAVVAIVLGNVLKIIALIVIAGVAKNCLLRALEKLVLVEVVGIDDVSVTN